MYKRQYVKSFKNIDAQVIADVTKTGFPYPTNGNFEWNTFVNDAIAMALSGQQPVEQALKDGAEKAQAVLCLLYTSGSIRNEVQHSAGYLRI